MNTEHVLRLFVALVISVAVNAAYGGKAGANAKECPKKGLKGHVGADDIQTNAKGWIIRVDRNKIFENLTIHNPISTEKWCFVADEAPDDDGNPRWLFPLEGARVRCLTIEGEKVNAVLDKDKGLRFETISLKGVQELQTIRFMGPVPEFVENTRWYGAKDSDWRKRLTTVFVDSNADGVTNIPFRGDIKCLEFGTNAVTEILGWINDCSKLRGCSSLERLTIPYSVATNSTINWGKIIRETGLKDKEVVAFERGGEGLGEVDTEDQDIVLLNLASNGEISDFVTTIRADAIPDGFAKRVFLPFKARRVIGDLDTKKHELSLKKDSVLFYPDILDSDQRGKLEKSRSFSGRCSLLISTAYDNLRVSVATNGCKGCKGEVSFARFAQDDHSKPIELWRGEKLKNSVSPKICLLNGSCTNQYYDVRMVLPANSKTIEECSVTFEHSAWTCKTYSNAHPLAAKLICLCLFASLLGVLYSVVAVFLWVIFRFRNHQNIGALSDYVKKRRVLPALGVSLGLVVMILGWEEIEILQLYVDKYLTSQTMSYLNASFISSLVISVSTSLTQLAVGFLQGFSFSIFGLAINLDSVLEPVQNVMDKVSTYSWISTGVLAFVRIFCQILKDGARLIWPVLGGSVAAYSMWCAFGARKGRRWIVLVMSVSFFLMLGLPMLLWLCSSFSHQMQEIAGGSFSRAMHEFATLAESFSPSSLTSVAGAQDMLAQFTNAVSSLTSSAMYYIATKAFDCFLVPLVLYFGFKKALSAWSDRKDELLAQVKESIDKSNASLADWFVRQGKDGQDNPSQQELSPSAILPESGDVVADETITSRVKAVDRIPAAIQTDPFKAFMRRIKPEWVTAVCAIAIFITVLFDRAVVSVATSQVGSGGQVSSKAVSSGLGGISCLGWIVIALFVVVDACVCWKAACVVRRIHKMSVEPSKKLSLLKEDDFYFDLPLYLGLFGTVLGFLFLSGQNDSQSGRVVAYFSTVFGIVVSVLIHAGVSQYKAVYMEVKNEDEVRALPLIRWGIICVHLMDRWVRKLDGIFHLSAIKKGMSRLSCFKSWFGRK